MMHMLPITLFVYRLGNIVTRQGTIIKLKSNVIIYHILISLLQKNFKNILNFSKFYNINCPNKKE